jgi:Type II restriction endonuclease EcoO109I
MSELTDNDPSMDIIAEIAKKCDGIGPSKAYAIAEDFSGDLQEFLKCDAARLLKIKRSTGSPLFDQEKAEDLIKCKSDFPLNLSVEDTWVFHIGREFLRSQIEHLESLSLASLDINPFLAKVLDLKTPKQVLEFNLYQNVTRSIVTSWGMTVEKILIHCGAQPYAKTKGGRSGRNLDISVLRDGKPYLMQIKSGPNTMNIDMIQSLNEVIINFKTEKPEVKVLLGMTYGRKEMISGQIRGTLDFFEDSILIGRDLWDFVSGRKDYHQKVFSLLDKASGGILATTFVELLHKQLDLLVEEWNIKYKDHTFDQVLENFI